MRSAQRQHVVIVAYDDIEILDLAGPSSVFTSANELCHARGRPRPYQLTIACAGSSGRVRTSSGVRLEGEPIASVRGPIDTLIVPGSMQVVTRPIDPALVAAVARAARRAGRVAGVCSGAFVLGAVGLLEGKRVATHWAGCAELQRRHPRARVESDAIFVHDGSLWTSAGVTAGIDLSLALVEADHGRDLALTIARWLVVYLHRPGGQSQFSVPLAAQIAARAPDQPLHELIAWMREHPSADLGVPALARRAGMSVRNFARVFRREVGVTPAAHVEALRVEAARRALESTALPAKRIAVDCGFGTVETFHRVFQRSLRVTPTDYRRRFQTRPRAASGR